MTSDVPCCSLSAFNLSLLHFTFGFARKTRKWKKATPRRSVYWRFAGIFLAPFAALGGYTQFQLDKINLDAIVIFAVVSGGVLAFVRSIEHSERRVAQRAVEIDYDEGVAIFYNYYFIAKFYGDKTEALKCVPLTGIYKANHTSGKDNEILELTTVKGLVALVGLEGMNEVRNAFSEIIRINEESNPDFYHHMEAAPKPKTPWYGWAIILGAVGLFFYVVWLTMFSR